MVNTLVTMDVGCFPMVETTLPLKPKLYTEPPELTFAC